MKINTLTLFVALAALVQQGCIVHDHYPLNSHNVPLFTKGKESRGVIGMGTQQFLRTADLQTAHALNDRFAVQVNGNYLSGNDGQSSIRGGIIEAAAGIFKFKPNAYAKDTWAEGWVKEVYGGFGWGRMANKYYEFDGGFFGPPTMEPKTGTSNIKLTRVFLQPAIGFRNPVFELAISSRLAYLRYYDGVFTGTSMEAMEDYRFFRNKVQFFVAEPAATMRMGWQKVKIQGQMGFSTIPQEIGPKFYLSGGLILSL